MMTSSPSSQVAKMTLKQECLPPQETMIWRGLVGEAVLALVLVGDGRAQFGDAGGGGVFGEAGGQRLGAGVLDVLRRVEVRLAGAEADDVQAVGLHLLWPWSQWPG